MLEKKKKNHNPAAHPYIDDNREKRRPRSTGGRSSRPVRSSNRAIGEGEKKNREIKPYIEEIERERELGGFIVFMGFDRAWWWLRLAGKLRSVGVRLGFFCEFVIFASWVLDLRTQPPQVLNHTQTQQTLSLFGYFGIVV